MTGQPPDPRKPNPPRDPLPLESTTPWLCGEGEAVDVVMSSRVRLARNIAALPFIPKSGKRERLRTLEIAREHIFRANLSPKMVQEKNLD